MANVTKEEAYNGTVSSLFEGMNSFLSTKSVVGEPIHVDDTVIIPLVKVSFGMGAGAFSNDSKTAGGQGGGIGGKMTPNAVIIIKDGRTRLIDIATNNGINKLLDLVPDFVNNFIYRNSDKPSDAPKEAKEAAARAMEESIADSVENAAR